MARESYDIPHVLISRAILTLIDMTRICRKSGRDQEWIFITDIVEIAGVNYSNLYSYIKRYRNNGIEVLTLITEREKPRAIRISEDFEQYLRDNFRPFDAKDDNKGY